MGFVIGNRALLERTRTWLDVSVSKTGNTTVNVFIFESLFLWVCAGKNRLEGTTIAAAALPSKYVYYPECLAKDCTFKVQSLR